MDKIYHSIEKTLGDISDNATVLIGGFGGGGTPYNLINELIEQGAKGLTVICNGSAEWELPIEHGRVRYLITGFGRNPYSPEITKMITEGIGSGQLEVEVVPHGILEERIRAGGMGIKAFYVDVGIGTEVEKGKEKRLFDGKEYILEHAIRGDFALIKGFQADKFGNVVCRLASGNRNITMASAADVTIVEVEEIVDPGKLDPNRIDIPGIFIDRVVQAPKHVRWLQWKV